MNSTHEDVVGELIVKAGKAAKADEALKFSQAACNAGNALRVLIDAKLAEKS